MADDEVLVTKENASENGEFIFRRLPSWMPTDEGDGNFKLLDPIGLEFDSLDDDIDLIDKNSSVQTADSKETIRELSRLVEELPKRNETVEEYRLRVIATFQKLTTEGTLEDIFGNIATLLDISPRRISYEDLEVNGEILLGVPGDALDGVALSQEKFAEVLLEQSAAGFSIDVKSRGTFTYITPTDYNNDLHDATKGYDGLDSNGDPKDNGGTYAGVLS